MADNTSSNHNHTVPVEEAIEAFLRDKGKGDAGESGNYRSDAGRELRRFIEWLRNDLTSNRAADASSSASGQPTPTFHDLDERTFRRYARELVSKGYAAGTTRTYYAYIASFCGWAVDEGHLERHHANTSRARGPLPEDDGRRSGDQQAWEPEQRDLLTRHVDEQAEASLDALDMAAPSENRGEYAAIKAHRDRGLVYVLCYTGVRGAEIFRDPNDERRQGLRWSDLNLDDHSMTVFRKNQRWSDAALPEPVIHPLRSYRRLLDPPNESWPVFPTFHYPTLGEIVRKGLADAGYNPKEIENVRSNYRNDFLVTRAHDLGPPPSIAPDAARRCMKRLCEVAELDIDDAHGYLAPHGGRRGMGETLVRQFGYAAAARYLDNSEQVVRESYSHIEANEQADIATEGLAATDQRVREPTDPADRDSRDGDAKGNDPDHWSE